jgi:uncharacterized protein (TIGR01319 family)
MPIYCLFDVGSTFTKGCLVDTDQEVILALANDVTTAESDIAIGIARVKAKMKPVIDQVKIDQTLICSSAKGGLKMIAVGLVPDLTLKAATLACYSAGAKVIKTYAFELNQSELHEISAAKCDILLLSGGTDGGNTEVVKHNAAMIASLSADFPVIYAGNKACVDEVKAIFAKTKFDFEVCENVMPSYGIIQVDSCRTRIRELFLKTIIKAKGLTELSALIDDLVNPTPSSVMAALKLLSQGTKNEPGLGDLMAIDIGGATTDVYSMNSKFNIKDQASYKGLREPLEKRSVEGDLGVRFSAAHVASHKLEDPLYDERMVAYLKQIDQDPHGTMDSTLDSILAGWCTEIAAQRHAGRLETAYSPMGVSTSQSGKDLTQVKTIIGIGGPLIHAQDTVSILNKALWSVKAPEILLPEKLSVYLDSSYVISCLGLLAQRHPDVVLRLLKKTLEKRS